MYLGWDIGIKNLAYCLIKKLNALPVEETDRQNILKLGNNYYKIEDWDVINIIPRVNNYIQQRGEIVLQQRPVVKCKAILGPGNKAGRGSKKARSRPVSPAFEPGSNKVSTQYCNKAALACLTTDPVYDESEPEHKHGYQGYCGTHLKRANLTRDQYLDAKLTACVCHVKVTDKKTGDESMCGTKAMYVDRKHYFRGYCTKHYNAIIKETGSLNNENPKMTEKDFLKVVRGKKSTQLDLTHLGTALFDELSKRQHLHKDAVYVLLENQPVLTNPTMKSVQMFMHSYFMDYGIRKEEGGVKEIHCYSASKKLDLIKYVPSSVYESIKTEAKTIPKKYGRHKRIAIRLCENFLGPDSTIGIGCGALFTKFKGSKKRDDLADSLLMTLHYLEKDILKNMKTNNELAPLLRDTKVMSDSAPLVDSGSDESNISTPIIATPDSSLLK